MLRTLTLSTIASAYLMLSCAQTDDQRLRPMQAATFDLGDHTAVIYYTHKQDAYELVTTIGPDLGTEGLITRYVTPIQDNEEFSFQIGQPRVGALPIVVDAPRHGDKLDVIVKSADREITRAF
jgi:hypothetical protein